MRELQPSHHDAGLRDLRSEEDAGEALREKERWKRLLEQALQHMRRTPWEEEER